MNCRTIALLLVIMALVLPLLTSAKCRCEDDRDRVRVSEEEDNRVGRECCKQPWERLTLEHKREKDRQRRLREAAEREREPRPKRACTCRLCGCDITRATYVKTDGDDGDCRKCGFQNDREVDEGDVCRECVECGRPHGTSKLRDCACGQHGGKGCDCLDRGARRGWADDDEIDTAQERLGWVRRDWRDRHAGSSFLRDEDD